MFGFDLAGRSLGAQEYSEMMAKQAEINARHAARPPVLDGTISHPPGMRYDPMTDTLVPAITRFDPSTNTRVPVTQEWVDEAVAEIVRLNVELSTKAEPMPGTDMLKVDHIWEAVRAASAV